MTKAIGFDLFKTRYMWAKGEIVDGDLYTKAGTAPAVVVLPYRVNFDDPQRSELVLLEQHRPETGDSLIKTVGGYIKEGETPEECVQRNLIAKLGFRALDIRCGGRTIGYTVVNVPIQYFYVTEWDVVGAPQQGCAPLNSSLSGAIALARAGKLCDDATVIPIYDLALRLLGA
ncbi:MAG: NUDIX domain-containing protein [Patescibacteria group bacterium]|nr:NUDIX domain-containing protein [Patescibacteria group bacterium]